MEMKEKLSEWITESCQETYRLGEKLAYSLEKGDIVGLSGDLGTGKTIFIQGVCHGLNVTEPVSSPSFTLVQEYSGRIPVFHFDFYRLETILEIETLDLDHYFNMNGICLIEWADKAEALLPWETLFIKMHRFFENGKIAVQKRLIQIHFHDSSRWLGLVL